MKLGALAQGEFGLREAWAERQVAGLTSDSRTVGPGFLFAALPGVKADGKAFIDEAIAKGAIAILCDDANAVGDADVAVLASAEPRLALAQLSARYFPRQPQVMAAVTGTAGKTSVAAFLRQIWEFEGKTAASIGTTGVVAPGLADYGNLTTPDPVALHRLLDDLAGRGVSHGSMEASSHGLDQHRLDGVRLSAAGFTNLGHDHLDYHPDMEHYFAAKMRLFSAVLPGDAPAVIFADDEWSARAIEAASASGREVLTVGRGGNALALKRVEHERWRQIAEIHAGSEIHRIEFPLAGDFQIANGLVAAGLAIATGSEAGSALAALEGLKGASGRLEWVGSTTFGAPVYVDYAHKPEALENVLLSLRPFVSGRLLVVFGCGGDRDAGKRPMMGDIAARLADIAIVTDDNPRTERPAAIRAEIMAACPGGVEIGDRREAIFTAIDQLGAGDALVVAGKGHEEGQIVGETTLPFSDHAVVREALAAQGADGALADAGGRK